MNVSIIIPAYNEERTIAQLLDRVAAARLPEGMTREIIVINDGSTDNTVSIVREYVDRSQVHLLHQDNAGKADAVLKGIEASKGDIILIQDADLEYDPDQYAQLLAPIADGTQLVVYGSRFMGTIENMRKRIRLVNFFTNSTLNAIFGCKLTDNNTCYKVFKKEVFDGLEFTSTHFGWDCEVTVKLLQKGIHIHEVPIRYKGRTKEEGKKINFVTGFGSYLQIFRYAFLDKGKAAKPVTK